MLERVESKTRSQKSSHMKATDLIANLQFLLYHLSPAQSLLYHLLPPARPASSVPSSISSPVISSSTSAVACSKHVIGASGKKFKAFHKKDGSESGSCELIDHPTNSNVQGAVDNTPLPTTICDLNEIANLFAACACPVCGQSEESRKRGMAVYLKVTCSNCDTSIGTNYTSATMPAEKNLFEVTKRTVTASVVFCS